MILTQESSFLKAKEEFQEMNELAKQAVNNGVRIHGVESDVRKGLFKMWPGLRAGDRRCRRYLWDWRLAADDYVPGGNDSGSAGFFGVLQDWVLRGIMAGLCLTRDCVYRKSVPGNVYR